MYAMTGPRHRTQGHHAGPLDSADTSPFLRVCKDIQYRVGRAQARRPKPYSTEQPRSVMRAAHRTWE